MINLFVVHNTLPPEVFEKILKYLSYKDLFHAQLICRRWKEIIDKGNVLKKALGNIPSLYSKAIYVHMCIFNFEHESRYLNFYLFHFLVTLRKNILHNHCWRKGTINERNLCS